MTATVCNGCYAGEFGTDSGKHNLNCPRLSELELRVGSKHNIHLYRDNTPVGSIWEPGLAQDLVKLYHGTKKALGIIDSIHWSTEIVSGETDPLTILQKIKDALLDNK